MARLNPTKSLKLVLLLVTFCVFLVIQNIASRYHSTVYQLTPFSELQASYESTIATAVSTQDNILVVDFQNCFDVNVTTGNGSTIVDVSTCLNRLIIDTDRVTVTEDGDNYSSSVTDGTTTTASGSSSTTPLSTTTLKDMNILQSWLNQSLESTDAEYVELLRRFNLSINSARGFDPTNNLNDKYLYLTLRHVEQLDRILQLNYSLINNPVDRDIDKRRSQGKLTNLKISDFADITRIRYGARSCDNDSGMYGSNLTAIVLVITKPNDFKIRSLIRKTWGAKFAATQSAIRLYFTFGLTPAANMSKSEPELMDQLLREESDQFEDIIQWNFDDGYYRLTIKSVAILRWACVYCPRVPVVFKIDADCMLNYDNLAYFTERLMPNLTNQYYIFGNLWKHASVIRTTQSKFFTSFRDYSLKTYPEYVGGPWYLAGRELPLFMFRMAVLHSMPALLWEDLYVTGIVAQKLIDAQFPLERRFLDGFEYNVDLDKLDYCLYNRSTILTQSINESNLEEIWARIKEGKLASTRPPKRKAKTLREMYFPYLGSSNPTKPMKCTFL